MTSKIQSTIDIACGEDDKILLADGFEDAFVGIATQFNKMFSVYDREKCIDILISRDGMTNEEAEEYFQFNVEGAWMGEATPAFITQTKTK